MKKTSDAIGFFGGSKPVACPNCGKTVNMQMLRSSNGIGAFGISVLFGVDRKVSKVEARDTMNQYLDIPAESLKFQQVLPIKD